MAKTTMSTVDKALALLRHFSVQTPELGLSELSRLAGYDKTTTLRCMTALERNGFIEQDAVSRKYRLGLAPINLAQTREHSFPVRSVLKRYLDELVDELGETAHSSLLMGEDAVSAVISEPDRALRVYVDPSMVLPLHATASGIAIAAHLPREKQAEILARTTFEAYTNETPTHIEAIQKRLDQCRAEGFGRADQTFEKGVTGTAVPIFGAAGNPIGSIAIAAVSIRLTSDLQSKIDAALLRAAANITRELGGVAPKQMRRFEETTK